MSTQDDFERSLTVKSITDDQDPVETPTQGDFARSPTVNRLPDHQELPVETLAKKRLGERRRNKVNDEQLQGWQNWSKFRLWSHTRPLVGSLLMILGAAIMLGDAVYFLSLAFLVQSLWPAILISSLLLVMGLIQLFLPTYSVITGSIGIVLSLTSLLVASFGGCGIGLLFGVVGSALSIAWRPVPRSRLLEAKRASSPH